MNTKTETMKEVIERCDKFIENLDKDFIQSEIDKITQVIQKELKEEEREFGRELRQLEILKIAMSNLSGRAIKDPVSNKTIRKWDFDTYSPVVDSDGCYSCYVIGGDDDDDSGWALHNGGIGIDLFPVYEEENFIFSQCDDEDIEIDDDDDDDDVKDNIIREYLQKFGENSEYIDGHNTITGERCTLSEFLDYRSAVEYLSQQEESDDQNGN